MSKGLGVCGNAGRSAEWLGLPSIDDDADAARSHPLRPHPPSISSQHGPITTGSLVTGFTRPGEVEAGRCGVFSESRCVMVTVGLWPVEYPPLYLTAELASVFVFSSRPALRA